MSNPEKRPAPLNVILCYLVENLPIPHFPSVKLACVLCERPVWLSKGTHRTMKAHKIEADPICEPCAILNSGPLGADQDGWVVE